MIAQDTVHELLAVLAEPTAARHTLRGLLTLPEVLST